MRAGLSFSYPPISLLLRQPLSIKKSYAGAIQSYMRKGFPIYEEMRKFFTIYEKAVSHI
jgi:hypothetical protein